LNQRRFCSGRQNDGRSKRERETERQRQRERWKKKLKRKQDKKRSTERSSTRLSSRKSNFKKGRGKEGNTAVNKKCPAFVAATGARKMSWN